MAVHYGRTAEELLELLNEVGSLPDEVRAREALAAVVDWSPEECVKRGLAAWVREAIKPRHASVLVVKGVRDAFDVGLGTAKVLCDNVYSDPSHIEELSAAVHAGDELLTARIFVERYFCEEPDKSGARARRGISPLSPTPMRSQGRRERTKKTSQSERPEMVIELLHGADGAASLTEVRHA